MSFSKIYEDIVKVGIVIAYCLVVLLLPATSSAATTEIEMWWPIEGAHLTGAQPLKGLQKGSEVSEYVLYWQVDGGELIPMNTSFEGYAHKEAVVDFSNWHWNGAGPYQLTFVSKNKGGTQLAQTSMKIYVDSNVNVKPTTDTTPTQSSAPANFPVIAPVVQQSEKVINVWWPSDNAHVSGLLTLKAMLEGEDISNYALSWQVDGGSEQVMTNSYADYPHKEYALDVSSWNWHGKGAYLVTFLARRYPSGPVIGKTSRSIYIDNAAPSISTTPAYGGAPVPVSGSTVLQTKLYVDPSSSAAQQVAAWSNSRPQDAALLQKIANSATAVWLGSWSSDAETVEKIKSILSSARARSSVPTFVLYNIPSRDCGGYSAGGSNEPRGYEAWISKVTSALGKDPSIVVLEPDALAQLDCLTGSGQTDRVNLLHAAVDKLKAETGARVYLDAGHSGWVAPAVMSERLKRAGIEGADGFALNVSNFETTNANIDYGTQISKQTGNSHFIVDTSRNGRGSNGEWCNPNDRGLGQQPTTATGQPLVDAYLWLKVPGESDGSCNGGPSAGSWWSDYALGLASRAVW